MEGLDGARADDALASHVLSGSQNLQLSIPASRKGNKLNPMAPHSSQLDGARSENVRYRKTNQLSTDLQRWEGQKLNLVGKADFSPR